MSVALRNSNPLTLHIASLLGAFLLSVIVFLIFPFSQNLSVDEVGEIKTENKKTFVNLSQPVPEVMHQNNALKNIRAVNTNSQVVEQIEIEIPASDFAKIAVEGAKDVSKNFALHEFAAEFLTDASSFKVKIFEISELDFTPKCKKRGSLQYPRKLFERGIEGEVRLMVFINENGTVELDSVQSFTHEEFLQSAKKSLKEMLYDPPTFNGEPVRARFILPVTFKITK